MRRAILILATMAIPTLLAGQSAPAPLTNAAVLKMFKGGLPASVIAGSIRANDSNFDLSPEQLVALGKAGLPEKILQAMVEAGAAKRTAIVPASTPLSQLQTPAPAPIPMGMLPGMMPGMTPQASVTLIVDGARQPIATERLQSVKTTVSPSKIAPLLSAGSQDANSLAVNRPGMATLLSGIGMVGNTTSRVAGGNMSTYLWGLPGATSVNLTSSAVPQFEVSFAGIPGVNPDEFEPRIVRLNPTKDNWRLEGITRMKETLSAGPAPAWPSYTGFTEETVPSKKEIRAPGEVSVTPQQRLEAGQYAIVLRPTMKSKKFSGEDVNKGQGEGALFGSAWSFTVPKAGTAPSVTSSVQFAYAVVDSVEYRVAPTSTLSPKAALASTRQSVLRELGATGWESTTDASGISSYLSPDRRTMVKLQSLKRGSENVLLVDRLERPTEAAGSK